MGFTAHPSLPGVPRNLRCKPTVMASSEGLQRKEEIGPYRLDTGMEGIGVATWGPE